MTRARLLRDVPIPGVNGMVAPAGSTVRPFYGEWADGTDVWRVEGGPAEGMFLCSLDPDVDLAPVEVAG